MRRFMKAAVATTFAAGVMTTISATNAQAAGPVEGCPYGAVCIYPQNAGWNNGQPSDFYYSYGPHNLRGKFGIHRIFNNQYGGATMRTCTGYDGNGCQGYLREFTYEDVNLTPINSITLER